MNYNRITLVTYQRCMWNSSTLLLLKAGFVDLKL